MSKGINASITSILSKLENKYWPERNVILLDSITSRLEQSALTLADVGAAYGVEPRWKSVQQYCSLITFEPDGRSQNLGTGLNFPIGLGDKRENRILHLATFPPASSIYQYNEKLLKDFAVWDLHEVVEEVQIELDSFDHVMKASDLAPDFMKVDVEGADFSVLVGAEKYINSSIKAVQIEVSFVERHLDSPTFPVIHEWMIQKGFQLHMLAREHWLRNNLEWGITSQPQLIWADAVYFLTKDELLKRLTVERESVRPVSLAHFILICLVYGAHDFAQEILDSVDGAGLIKSSIIIEYKKAVSANLVSPTWKIAGLSVGVLLALVIALFAQVVRPFRVSANSFLKRRIKDLAYYTLQICSRGGYRDSCFSDPFR